MVVGDTHFEKIKIKTQRKQQDVMQNTDDHAHEAFTKKKKNKKKKKKIDI